MIFHHLIFLTEDCHYDTQVDFSLVQENIILEEPMSFFAQWLEIIGNEWSRFLKNRFYIQENSKTLVIVQAMHIFTFQLKQEIFGVLKSMYGTRAVMPEEVLVPDWHRFCRQSAHIFDS